MSNPVRINPDRLAPEGSFKRAEQEVLIQGMRRTFRERLAWNEEACRFADELKARNSERDRSRP